MKNTRDLLLDEASYCEMRCQPDLAAVLRSKAAAIVGGPTPTVVEEPEAVQEVAEEPTE